MFNINGPSGPTSRHERRVRNSTPLVDKKEIRRKMDTFFETKKPLQSSSKVGTTGTKDNKSKLYLDPKKSIFKGCTIYFNGRTGNVSSYFLTKLVEEHGGNVSSAHTRSKVTHVVCTNLSHSKADKVIKSCGRIICVRPEWILRSVKRQKREPEFEYLVYKEESGANCLKSMFDSSNNSSSKSK